MGGHGQATANLSLLSGADTEGLQIALSIVPRNEVQEIAARMVSSLQSACDARLQRIIISESINWVSGP
jgi:hypothetical protein